MTNPLDQFFAAQARFFRAGLAVFYAKARHRLDDYQNKQALRIVRETQAIGLETLNVHGMSRIHGRSVLTVARHGS